MENITNLSNHKKQFQTPRMKVPAVLHVSDDLMPNDETLSEIENAASSEHVFHHVAAMSDVHSKKGRKNPTGTVVASEKFLLPQINDTAPNCGMRLIKTDLNSENLSPEKIDELFKALIKTIPTKTYVGTPIPYSLVMNICRFGVEPVTKFFKSRTANEIENTYKNGNFFETPPSERDILDAIPKFFLHVGKYRPGILGAAGNHFLDLMKITDIVNPDLANSLGIFQGQYVFVLHTGSGLLGQYASYMYTPKRKEHLSQRIMLELGILSFDSQMKRIYKNLAKKIREFQDKDEFFAYEDGSPEAKMFLTAHRAAANHGFANRCILTHQLDQTIEKVLGKKSSLDLLYDTPHVFIDCESHFGKDVWIHRNGSVRSFGPSRMSSHPIFSRTGEPVALPSSMSTPAYIGTGTDENESAFFSAAHGTGRRKNPETDKAESKKELFGKLEKRNVKLYNAKSKGVVFQDAGYYKDVEEVIAGMVENKIINLAAKMEPVAVLMY